VTALSEEDTAARRDRVRELLAQVLSPVPCLSHLSVMHDAVYDT
jgi:hypothetical protein